MFCKQSINGRQVSTRFVMTACFFFLTAVGLVFVSPRQPAVHSDVANAVPKAAATPVPAVSQQSRALARYQGLPISFEPTQGQIEPRVKFLSRGHGYSLFLTSSEAVLSLPIKPADSGSAMERPRQSTSRRSTRAIIRMQFVGARHRPQIAGEGELPGKSNYFIGNDPTKWHSNIPQFSGVRYREVYPGVDLVFHGAEQQQLEFDFVLNPGASPDPIALKFSGARELRIDDSGDLVLASAAGDVRVHKPVAYQESDIDRRPVETRFFLQSRNQVALELGSYDHTRRVVIDPTLAYATYLGSSGEDEGFAIATDSSGNAYVAGEAGAVFLNTTGSFGGGAHDAFVAKLNPSASGAASLVYVTYLGGLGDDSANAVAVDASGNAYVAGGTASANFPTTPGVFQTKLGTGATDNAFVAKLGTNGALIYATYLGGSTYPGTSKSDVASAIAVDGSGNAYVAGQASSTNFPVQNAFQTNFGGGFSDAFVTLLNSTATPPLIYSTYLGGADADNATAIALDSANKVYVAGVTLSSGSSPFPTAGTPYQSTAQGADDGFVAKLDTTKSGTVSLVYSTYLGGSGKDDANGIAVDSAGAAYVTGLTQSSNFPSASAYQASLKGTQNAFVTKLNAAGSGIVYSTYLGGSNLDVGTAITLDSVTNSYITGQTSSSNFPTQNPTQGTYGGGLSDAFVSVLNSSGNGLFFSTFLGGSAAEDTLLLGGIALDRSNNIFVTGDTASTNFRTTASAFQGSFQGGTADAFVAEITAPSAATFTLTVSPGSATVTSGQSTSPFTVTMSPGSGFGGTVTLSCSALPAGAACSFNPASVSPSAPSSQLTISTTVHAAQLVTPVRFPALFYGFCLPGLAVVGVGFGVGSRGKRKGLLGLLIVCVLMLALLFQVACGGGSGSSSGGGGGGGGSGTPPGTYTITVSGASTSGSEAGASPTVSLTVK